MFNKYDAYKDSGVQWIDEIPSEWSVLRAKNFFNFRKIINSKYQCDNVLSLTLRGVVNNSFDNPEGLIPKDYATYQIFNKNDLVFKLIDLENISTSRIGLVHEKGIMSPAYIRLECKETVIPKFAYYYFYNLYLQTVFNKLGAGVRSTLSPKDLLELPYLHLCKEQQIKIVDYLDQKNLEIDQAIAIKQQQIALLNERKQIVIQKAVTQGLNPNVAMKDSGVEWIGQIPAHWKVLKFKRACQFIYDGTHGSYPRVEQGYRLLSVRNIINNEFVFREDDSCVSQKHFKEISSKFLIRNDDIQLAIVGGTLGKAAIVKDLEEEIVTQRSLATLRTQPSVLNPNFLLSFIRSPKYQNFLWANAGFSAQPGVYLNTIQNSYLCMPCSKEQTLITEYIENETRKFSYLIGNIKDQIEKLKEYKTTLINDAVTGKIKVA
ncbi:hypothetical protein ACT43R_03935 [Acinetobacter baumannii]|uniref:hypothetical protein n=1 Tax=Acinetobacter baumannii TaxID=470 RepID=UPI00135F92A7|nr:hypothetical protein [Acinetobacter baumannii]MDC4776037.1 hypothetical protein [Acinetobacter baumannii]MDC5148678.1 hypothetical protein [Acinetobacter baumannii]MDV4326306.1 hypothetical protein [Acinetobacter baumannii]CAA0201346.1 type I restriction-modification system specificity determinant for hsdM and hsdR (HsdS) [Acinetobacter baumannii]